MRADLNTILTVPDAAILFSHLRGVPVSRHTITNWITRYALVKNGAGYRYGDLLTAEARARRNNSGGGRGRPKAAA